MRRASIIIASAFCSAFYGCAGDASGPSTEHGKPDLQLTSVQRLEPGQTATLYGKSLKALTEILIDGDTVDDAERCRLRVRWEIARRNRRTTVGMSAFIRSDYDTGQRHGLGTSIYRSDQKGHPHNASALTGIIATHTRASVVAAPARRPPHRQPA